MKHLDPFLISLVCAIALASIFPASGKIQNLLNNLTYFLIAMMFFFQGVKLERNSLIGSIKNWNLQIFILFFTFVIFPFLGISIYYLYSIIFTKHIFEDNLWKGILFLCCLPSTVQSSIALTSIAKGNVSSAICAATISNILGVIITPLLCNILIGHKGNNSSLMYTLSDLSKELFIPFILGQLCQGKLYDFVKKHKYLISLTDRGSILFVVYCAFSTAVLQGIWSKISLGHIVDIFSIDLCMLIVILFLSYWIGKKTKQSVSDCIVLQFCGSKKSLASGIPMASIIFPTSSVGIIVIPLLLYHQSQLFICTLLARRYSKRKKI